MKWKWSLLLVLLHLRENKNKNQRIHRKAHVCHAFRNNNKKKTVKEMNNINNSSWFNWIDIADCFGTNNVDMQLQMITTHKTGEKERNARARHLQFPTDVYFWCFSIELCNLKIDWRRPRMCIANSIPCWIAARVNRAIAPSPYISVNMTVNKLLLSDPW